MTFFISTPFLFSYCKIREAMKMKMCGDVFISDVNSNSLSNEWTDAMTNGIRLKKTFLG